MNMIGSVENTFSTEFHKNMVRVVIRVEFA